MSSIGRNLDLTATLIQPATAFRAALDRLRDEWPALVEETNEIPRIWLRGFERLKRFPGGCCDATSMLLARYLYEQGFDARTVRGYLKTDHIYSHEWVEVGDVIVDVTADQFDKIEPQPASVIVTRDRAAFHDRYEVVGTLPYTEGWAAWGWTEEESISAVGWLYEVLRRLADADVGSKV